MQVLDSYGTLSRNCHHSGGGWASVVQQVLGEADWRTLDAAFAENRDPLTGHPPSHEYEQLFSRTFRTEVLDAWLFNSIEQVQAIADDWLTQYNEYRPHDALGGKPPRQFMPRLITTTAADSGNQLSA